MATSDTPTAPHRPKLITRTVRVLPALLAGVLAFFVTAIVIGAYFPKIPKVGVIGPVLGGQYPFLIALIAVISAGLAALSWRLGLRRWGAAVVATALVSSLAALGIGAVQIRAALNAGAPISWSDVATELSYPTVEADKTGTYASPDGQPLQYDAYLPTHADERGAPAVILAHAGGFHTFDRSDLRGTGRWLADRGVAVFAVDYRLADADTPTWNKAPQDLVSALAWVRDNASDLGVDPKRVSLGGMSAGGTLAMNASYRMANGEITTPDGRAVEAPASVVGFYPGTDVTRMWHDDVAGTREAAEMFTGGTPDQFPERYREVSPTSDVRAGLPRTLLVVGDRDRSARPETVTAFADSLTDVDVETTVEVLPFAEHAFDDAYGSITSQTSRQILLDFLSRR